MRRLWMKENFIFASAHTFPEQNEHIHSDISPSKISMKSSGNYFCFIVGQVDRRGPFWIFIEVFRS